MTEDISNESADELAGQRLMLGFDGTRFDDDLRDLIARFRPGGLILFKRNVEDPDRLRALCADAQAFARSLGLPPLLFSIDQEGGAVARLGPPFTVFPGNPAMADEADAERFGRISAAELLDVGIGMNLAPVMDVVLPGEPSVMESRVFAGGPDRVARMGCRVVRALQENGVLAVAKHFPGIGRTVLDSHEDLPRMSESRAEIERVELPPFRAAVREGVAGIMLSHILYPALDPEWPAGLSVAIARDLLRGEMGYDGLVLTDDLDMGAIRRHFSIAEAIPRILAAEVDLILVCRPGPAQEQARDEIRRHIRADPDLRAAARRSAERILRAKRRVFPEERTA
jgi:beta-N-acetylhexosaminidase